MRGRPLSERTFEPSDILVGPSQGEFIGFEFERCVSHWVFKSFEGLGGRFSRLIGAGHSSH